MIFAAAAETKPFMEQYLPYMVLTTGAIAAILFLVYFMSDQNKTKRITGTLLAIVLAGFSVFCIFEGEGVRRGIDLKGGASFLVRVRPGEKAVTLDSLAQAQSIIDKRLNPTGSMDVTVTPQGADRLYIEVPGLSDQEILDAKEKIEKVARLQFRLLGPEGYTTTTAEDPTIKPGYTKLRYLEKEDSKTSAPDDEKKKEKPNKFLWAKNKPELGGKAVKNAVAFVNPGSVDYSIHVELDSESGNKMREITAANEGKPMAICLENAPGEFEIVSAPRINGVFGAQFEITGRFTDVEARTLASQLMNPLENPLDVEQSSTISPTYGAAIVQQGITSTLVGLGLTLLFMIIYYRLSGIIALIGLVVNLLLLLGAMRVFGQTLTMPGIAGIILTLGMAIDANVLIYERMREEFEAGRDFATAISSSYSKAFTAIFDSNSTSMITSIIMIAVASGSIRGFGLALTIGLVAHMFSALLITRVCFLWLHKFGLKKLSFMHLIKNKLYDFMGKRRICLIISGIVTVALLVLVAIKGKDALGYELRGGDAISLTTEGTGADGKKVMAAIPGLTLENVNSSLSDWKSDDGKTDFKTLNIGTVQPIGSGEYVHVRSNPGTAESIKNELIKDLAGGDAAKATAIKSATTESMGSQVGSEMLWRSLIALAAGLLGIFIYLTFRYEMPFAIGGIVAIFHDVTVAVGACVIAGKEIGLILIGAFLTIAGYSINDTIVIFDRVRDNLRHMKGDLEDILNASISATLSRTLITTLVTSLAVLSMFIFGGKSMADFSFAMLVGMATGIYSTIFIASPVVLWWAKRRKLNLRQQILDADAARLEALSGMEREAPAKPPKKGEDKDAGLTPA